MNNVWRTVELVGLVGSVVLVIATITMTIVLLKVGGKASDSLLVREIRSVSELNSSTAPSIAVTDVLLYATSLSRLGVDPVKVLREGKATVFHAEKADELEAEVDRLRDAWATRCRSGDLIEDVAFGPDAP